MPAKTLAVDPKKFVGSRKTAETDTKKVPAPPPQASFWRRRIPFYLIGIPVLLVALLGAVGYAMYEESQRQAPERIPVRKIAEFKKKKSTLASAQKLREQGKYNASLAAYDQYLRSYPHSTAAKQGRALTVAQIDRMASARTQTRTASASRPSRQRARSVAEQRASNSEKPSLRQRVRRIFKRPSS